MLHAHRQFHFALFRAGGDGVLQRHLCMLWNTCERYVMSGLPDSDRQAAAPVLRVARVRWRSLLSVAAAPQRLARSAPTAVRASARRPTAPGRLPDPDRGARRVAAVLPGRARRP